MYVGKSPVPVTLRADQQGQIRFNTYCSPCHDQTGMGTGIVPHALRHWQPANLTDDRMVQLADGDIFNVITNGRRTMPPYSFRVVTADRWAIIAYVRALQRAAHGTLADVPAGTDDRGSEITPMSQHSFHTTVTADNYQLETSRWTAGRNVLLFAALSP